MMGEAQVKTVASREDKILYCQITLKRLGSFIGDNQQDLQQRLKDAVNTGSDRDLELILNTCILIHLNAVEGSN